MNPLKKIYISLGVIILLWIFVDWAWISPQGELASAIEVEKLKIKNIKEKLKNKNSVNAVLEKFATETLGQDEEEVDHRLRVFLNKLVEDLDLKNFSVDTKSGRRFENPARRLLGITARESVDARSVFATLKGQLRWEKFVNLIDRLQRSVWIHQINKVHVEQINNGKMIGCTLDIETFWYPGIRNEEKKFKLKSGSPMKDLLIAFNPFEVVGKNSNKPSKASPIVTRPVKEPEFNYQEWRVTGVLQGADSVAEVLVAKGNKRRRLLVGDQIGNTIFRGTSGEYAWFETDKKVWEVRLGDSLATRRLRKDSK